MKPDLPVLEAIPALREKLRHNPIVILQAPPGAGKSTVLPLELLNEPWLAGKKMVMLEPRRLAAKSVAERMASQFPSETGGFENIGETIGYRVRFDSKVSVRTRIEVVTEGILTRMIQADNSLEEVGLLIFDEFHERSLNADLALALSLQIQSLIRPDLKILIMSATLDSNQLSAQIGNAPVITSQGRQFPVEIRYAATDSDTHISVRMAQIIKKVLREQSGDILAFLPGSGEIRRTLSILEEEGIGAKIHPLFGDLPFRQQQEAILPRDDGLRKIVLATSIAETSLTIEGVKIVIDGGLSRVPRFDPRSGLTRLETVRVTKDAADQRTGRAGRLGPGICYRLWTEAMQRNLLPQRKAEILEADLAPLMLELSQWGVKDVRTLTWITLPPAGAVSQAYELLRQLEAIDDLGITSRGKAMLRFPTHPRIAHMLELTLNQSERTRALASDIAALLEERDPLPRDSGADINLRLELLRKWRKGERVTADKNILDRIERLALNWRKILKIAQDNEWATDHETGRLLMTMYPERIARQQKKQSEVYTLSNGRVARLPDHDPLVYETWLCVAQLDAGQKDGRIFLAAPVDEADLLSLSKESEIVSWDQERNMVTAAIEKRVGGLVLERRQLQRIPEDKKNAVLISAIRERGLQILPWSDAARSLQSRMGSLRTWRPEEGWPDLGDNHLLETLEQWLIPFLAGLYKLSEIDRLDIHMILMSLVSWDLQKRMDDLVPTKLSVPSGSQIQVQYFPDGRAPVMEVRLQEMFGQPETPSINEGRTKILLHLLSPGYKPVQVTQDLSNFWHHTYHEVRKELRMRYPKHSWPEDPWTAVAVRGAKRRGGR